MGRFIKEWIAMIGCGRAVLIVAAAALSSVLPGRAPAQPDGEWRIDRHFDGKPKNDGSGSEPSKDVSGIACAAVNGFPRVCLLVDDETQGAQIAILKDHELVAGTFVRLIDDVHDGKLIELDAEGVAYADQAFYVVGSHGRPRHESDETKEAKNRAKAAASRRVIRIRLDPSSVKQDGTATVAPTVQRSGELPRIIKAQPELASSFDQPLDSNGVTIEGVAVSGSRLYFGFRGPVLDGGRAAVLSVAAGALFDGGADDARLHRLDLGMHRGVRDIVAYSTGFLVLAGPVNDPPTGEIKSGDYSVVWWDGDAVTKRLIDLASFGPKSKPEAILPLERTGDKLRALLLFDGRPDGYPTTIEMRHP